MPIYYLFSLLLSFLFIFTIIINFRADSPANLNQGTPSAERHAFISQFCHSFIYSFFSSLILLLLIIPISLTAPSAVWRRLAAVSGSPVSSNRATSLLHPFIKPPFKIFFSLSRIHLFIYIHSLLCFLLIPHENNQSIPRLVTLFLLSLRTSRYYVARPRHPLSSFQSISYSIPLSCHLSDLSSILAIN